jgi:hypothetical protein
MGCVLNAVVSSLKRGSGRINCFHRRRKTVHKASSYLETISDYAESTDLILKTFKNIHLLTQSLQEIMRHNIFVTCSYQIKKYL